MATNLHAGPARVFTGSVSERVLADSGRHVLLISPDCKRLNQIETLLVPVDGTVGGAQALATAVGLALSTGARLVLLIVVSPIPLWMYSVGDGFAPAMYLEPTREDHALRSAQAYVRGLSAQLQERELHVERLVVEGAVAPSIHAVAEETDADMVVMSTHALTGLARAVLGSVADAVVRTSQRPVLLVRRSGGALDDMEDTAETASEVVILSLAGR